MPLRRLAPCSSSRACGLAALISLALMSQAPAQVSGTWASPLSGNWSSSANWLGGAIPDGGGTATFNNALGQIGNITGTIDTTSWTLGRIVYEQGFSVSIAGSGGGGIVMSGSGLTIDSVRSQISSASSFFNTVNGISAVISGTGPLVKTGSGNAALSGANTFTGTVRLNEGALWLTAAGQNTALGNTANVLEFNGGTLGISTNALTSARTVVVNTGGGTIRNFAASTLSGTLTGAGTLAVQVATAATTLSGNVSGFTGGLRVDNGSLTLSATTALGGSAAIENGGTFTLANSTTNIVNRLNGRSIASFGGTLVYQGNAAAVSNETAGTLALKSGATTITMSPNAAQQANLQFSDIAREDRATLFVRGVSGAAPAAGVANVLVTAAPGPQIGGGGAATSSTASIVPWILNSTVNNTTTGTGLSFVTWDAASQRLIPLDTTTGYATTLATAAANENVSLNAGGTVAVNAGGQTVNALRFGAITTLSGAASDVLTVTSGAVLSTTSTSIIDAPLNFGSAEGVVYASGALTINGAIAGSNGLTKAGIGVLTLSAANTYTGPTTLTLGSTYVPGGIVTADGSAPSAFGQGTSPITILSTNNTANVSTRLYTTANLTINRDVVVKLGGAATTAIGTFGNGNESVTINGNVTLNAASPQNLARFLSLEGNDIEAEAVRINGNISGSGGLRANFAAYSILTGNHSYSGSTLVGTSTLTGGSGNTFQVFTETWDARSSTAFGTAPIYFHSTTNATQPVTGTGLIVSGGSGPNTFANDVILTNGFARFGGSQPLTLNGGMFLNSAATNNSVVSVESTSAPVTLNGIINGGGVIKHGAGTLTFTGANTYSGQTIVREGTLSAATIGNGGTVGNLGQAPANSAYLVLTGNAVGNTGTLAYSGAGESTDRLFTMQGSGGTIDASGSGALVLANTGTISQGAGTVAFSSTLVASAGVVGLTTSQAAQIVVGSAVTASGAGIPAGTTVTEVGVNFVRLSANGTNTAGAQTLTFTPPAALTSRVLTLTGSNTGNNTLAAVIADASGLPVSLVKNGSGTWRLSGANTYTGATTVQAGRLIGTTTSLQGTITTNAALEFNQTTDGTFAGDINGTGLFEKTGTGRLTLTGAALNTGFTGTVGVTGGILEVAPTTALGAGPVTVGSGASLEVRGTLTSTGVTIGSGATLTGTGAINGNVLMNGTLAPGGGPGTLSITGDLGLSAGSVLNFDLAETNQTAGGGINDLVIINGNLVLDGTLNVPDPTAVSNWTTNATLTNPIAWTLFTFTGSIVNNGLALGNLPTITGTAGPQSWDIGIVLNEGGGGSVKLVAVPEPSTALMVTGALVTGTVYLRRRRRTA